MPELSGRKPTQAHCPAVLRPRRRSSGCHFLLLLARLMNSESSLKVVVVLFTLLKEFKMCTHAGLKLMRFAVVNGYR